MQKPSLLLALDSSGPLSGSVLILEGIWNTESDTHTTLNDEKKLMSIDCPVHSAAQAIESE